MKNKESDCKTKSTDLTFIRSTYVTNYPFELCLNIDV